MLVRRSPIMTWFIIGWMLLFQYETLRANYLSPLALRLRSARAHPAPAVVRGGPGTGAEGLAGRELPKLKFLFPPAGWPMFFNISRSYGFVEVYGIRRNQPFLLDPHEIFETRALGYDNIRRNVLVGALSRRDAPAFCRYLRRKFPAYESFAVAAAEYPDLIKAPERILRQVAYRCE